MQLFEKISFHENISIDGEEFNMTKSRSLIDIQYS